MRLIDLDEIKPIDFPSYEMDGIDVVRYLNTLPTVDAVSIVQGQLVHNILTAWRCNMCGRMHDLGYKTPEEAHMNCCSSCGAVFNTEAYESMRKAVENKNRRLNNGYTEAD